MTSTVPAVEPTLSPLGDCLLHLEHHEMSGDCWRRTMTFWFQAEQLGWTQEQTVDRYKRHYEQLLLEQLIEQHAP